jgi:integrase
MVQLRREDVRQEGETWVLTLTPDAGAIKGKVVREVPLHPHLVEVGFIEFVLAAPSGYLFLNPSRHSDGELRGARRTIKNRLTDFIREVVTDPKVQPNHGWRHRFETIARELGLREEVTNAITGHATPGVAASYGNVTLAAKAEAIAKIPRVEVHWAP